MQHASQTAFELPAPFAGEEAEIVERAAPRTLLLYRASSIDSGGRRSFCVIKNVSTDGAMIQTSLPLAAGDPLTLELASGARIAGQVRWHDARSAGVQFDEPIRLAAVLDRSGGAEPVAAIRRMPRILLDLPVRLTDGSGRKISALIGDISTHGVRVACEDSLDLRRVRIALPHLGDVGARIAWTEGAQAGCEFDRPFGLDALALWIESLG